MPNNNAWKSSNINDFNNALDGALLQALPVSSGVLNQDFSPINGLNPATIIQQAQNFVSPKSHLYLQDHLLLVIKIRENVRYYIIFLQGDVPPRKGYKTAKEK